MFFDITPILNGETDKMDFAFDYLPERDGVVAALFPDIVFEAPVSAVGYVRNRAGYMFIHADASLIYKTACARCADPVEGKMNFSFEKDIANGGVDEESDDYIFVKNQKIDLSEPLEEELLLVLPAKTLCREDCRGLCPKCGKNLNLGDCDCEKSQGDPRLAILKTLLK